MRDLNMAFGIREDNFFLKIENDNSSWLSDWMMQCEFAKKKKYSILKIWILSPSIEMLSLVQPLGDLSLKEV